MKATTTTVTTRSKASKQAELHYIARAQFKATGAILYGVQSGENVYHVTICAGRVTGCCNANGEDCKGFHYQGHCKHSDYAAQLESARTEQVSAPIPVAVRDFEGYTAHLDCGDHREVVRAHDLPVLFPNGYRLIEKSDPDWRQWNERLSRLPDGELAAHVADSIRSGEFVNPFAGMSKEQQREAYRALYPDDFGFAA